MPLNCPISLLEQECEGCRYYLKDEDKCQWHTPSLPLCLLLTQNERLLRLERRGELGVRPSHQRAPDSSYLTNRINELEEKLNKHLDKNLRKDKKGKGVVPIG